MKSEKFVKVSETQERKGADSACQKNEDRLGSEHQIKKTTDTVNQRLSG